MIALRVVWERDFIARDCFAARRKDQGSSVPAFLGVKSVFRPMSRSKGSDLGKPV